jgi:indolepyruvate decarboxylase
VGEHTIGTYLIEQLAAHGVQHIFGVPGDYVLRFYQLLEQHGMQIINTCDEQGAGFAADAYARLGGLGAACVTYGAGGLKLTNVIAQAFAERVPVVVISGAPGLREWRAHPLLHHSVRDATSQLKVFEQITAAAAMLDDPATASHEIDRVLSAALQTKRPVYIELPRDMIALPAVPLPAPDPVPLTSDPGSLDEAVREAVGRLCAAEQPLILAGIELHRFGYQDLVADLARRSNIAVAGTLLGKSSISEREPFYIGLYQGAMSREEVRAYVESSDCVLLLGVWPTDLDLGGFTARLDPRRCITASNERVSVGYHTYEQVRLADFLQQVCTATFPPRALDGVPRPAMPAPSPCLPDDPITIAELYRQLGAFLTTDMVVIADPGDAMFAAGDLLTGRNEFLAPSYYASLGFAVPAAVGAQLACPALRPLVLVGDGAFQMTGIELSTAVRFGLDPIVILPNNGGYATERLILDGAFNDILPWHYSHLPDLLGAGHAVAVETACQLEQALAAARDHRGSYQLIEVRLQPGDISPALRRLAAQLAAQSASA